MREEPVLVAVDGGQSELRLAAAPSGARTPNPVSAPGFTWNDADPVTTIARSVATAWRTVHQDLGSPPSVRRVVLGLSGLPEDADERIRLATAVTEITDAEEIWLCRDGVTAHAGALPQRDGVVLTVGTGVACVGVVRDHAKLFQADGWGYLLGDAGGAFWIGRAGLQAVFRAYDGRAASTTLTARAIDRYGPATGIPLRVHGSRTHVDDIGRFAQDVCAEAEAGDDTARRIVTTAAAELAGTASAITTRYVRSTGRTAPLAVTGRLFRSGSLLHTRFVREVRRLGLRTQLLPPAGTSLDGAWALAVTADPDPYPVTRFRRP